MCNHSPLHRARSCPTCTQYADCCPQGLLHASRGFLGSGRVQALAVKAGSCTTTDEYRLLQGAAAVLTHLLGLRVDWHRLDKPYDAHFLPPASDSPHVQHAAQSAWQPPASVIAPIVHLPLLTHFSYCFYAEDYLIPLHALRAAVGVAARVASLTSLCFEGLFYDLSCAADGADPTLDLTPLASLRHLTVLHMHGCSIERNDPSETPHTARVMSPPSRCSRCIVCHAAACVDVGGIYACKPCAVCVSLMGAASVGERW